MAAAVRLRHLENLEQAEARHDRLGGSRLAAVGRYEYSLNVHGGDARRGLEEVRDQLRVDARGGARRFAEFELSLPGEVASRVRSVDSELTSRRFMEAAQRALERVMPGYDGVVAVRPGTDDQLRVHVLVSSPEGVGRSFAAAAERLDRAWHVEAHRAIGLAPQRSEPLAEERARLAEQWEIASERYRSAVFARMTRPDEVSQEQLRATYNEVSRAHAAYQELVRPPVAAAPAPRPEAERSGLVVREVYGTRLEVERGGLALGRFDGLEQTRVAQAAVERITGFRARGVIARPSNEGRDLEVVVYHASGQVRDAERARLREQLPQALVSVSRERGVEISMPGRVVFDADRGTREGPARLPETVRAVMPAPAPMREGWDDVRRIAYVDVRLESAAKFLERIPEQMRLETLNRAMHRAVPTTDSAALLNGVVDGAVIVRVVLGHEADRHKFQSPLVGARVTNELARVASRGGRDAEGPARGGSPGRENANAARAVERTPASSAGRSVGSAARAGSRVAGPLRRAAERVRPAVAMTREVGRAAAPVVGAGVDIVKQGADAHAVAHRGLQLLVRALPPAISRTVGKALEKAGREVIEMTRSRE